MSAPLSFTGRRWTLRNADAAADDIVAMLARERGIMDIGGEPVRLSAPMLFPEMGRAVDRIRGGIDRNETIAVFGDYDADGITAAAQIIRYFRRRSVEPVIYLPHRLREGYGLKTASIDSMHARGVTLIITVDTGIAAHREIEYASALGIDVIVTDHHHPSGGRPPAYAVIHTLIPSPFPNEHLSGAGVAFMLVRALETESSWPGIREDFVLAAVGTIADMVPLTGENRTLVMHGLTYLRTLPPGPLKEFADAVRVKGAHLSATDIAFRMVPRINASGRMADPAIALDALLTGGDALTTLHRLNTERQAAVSQLGIEADTLVDSQDLFLCVMSERFTPGLVGLIAGKLAEKHGRPVLAAAQIGDIATASLRSVPGIDIISILSQPSVATLLLTFGGHKQAAGCTFRSADFAPLRLALNAALAGSGISADDLVPTITIDAILREAHLSLSFVQSLQALEPFGQANEEPRFLLTNQRLFSPRGVGSDGRHLQGRMLGKKIIGFGLGSHLEKLSDDISIDIVCRLGTDSWNGANDVQLLIEDIRPVH